MDHVSSKAAIALCRQRFDKGQIVEAIIGRRTATRPPVQVVSVILRASKTAPEVTNLPLGIMSLSEYDTLLAWHEEKWIALMRDPKFRKWARRHPIPIGTE